MQRLPLIFKLGSWKINLGFKPCIEKGTHAQHSQMFLGSKQTSKNKAVSHNLPKEAKEMSVYHQGSLAIHSYTVLLGSTWD